jgi:hypothetical protein
MQLAPERATVLPGRMAPWADRTRCRRRDCKRYPVVRIKPGERIALDGTIVPAASRQDQPGPHHRAKVMPDRKGGRAIPVFAGTLNESGSFRIRSDRRRRCHATLSPASSRQWKPPRACPCAHPALCRPVRAQVYTPAVVLPLSRWPSPSSRRSLMRRRLAGLWIYKALGPAGDRLSHARWSSPPR